MCDFPSGLQWPHVSDPVTTDCLCSQLRLAYFCHSLQLWQSLCNTAYNLWSSALPSASPRAPNPRHLSQAWVLRCSCFCGLAVGKPSWPLTITTNTLVHSIFSQTFIKFSMSLCVWVLKYYSFVISRKRTQITVQYMSLFLHRTCQMDRCEAQATSPWLPPQCAWLNKGSRKSINL